MSENVSVAEAATIKSWMSNETYDALKFITQIVLPALGALYFALDQIWKLGYGEEIVGTLVAIVTFLGVLLRSSTSRYNKSLDSVEGVMNIDTSDPTRDIYSLDVLMPFEDIQDKDKVTFKVNKSQ